MFETIGIVLSAILKTGIIGVIVIAIRKFFSETSSYFADWVPLAIFCVVVAIWALPEIIEMLRYGLFDIYPSKEATFGPIGGLNIQTMDETYITFWVKVIASVIGGLVGHYAYSKHRSYW
ncbi:hypothetical protein [Yersinia hibernica]|uniref:Uncharacterized protein n=1 Tax=Yersinia enterocolitica LC20 TaxID=1443113 RepID=A0A7U4GE97_YEREN|nr:hypothetical protein [Yersinia hibernica]AHM72989.1 hypothetical protein LC20_01736 [Yersinia hibernica]